MLDRRYPHRDAGTVAAPLFGLVGAVAGLTAARFVSNSPPLVVNALLWAVVAAGVAYLVFSSEGPQQRPASMVQAAIADGVVAGIIVGVTMCLLDVAAAGGAGTTGGTPVTASRLGACFLWGFVGGSVAGGLVGYVACLAGGKDKFQRLVVVSRRTSRASKKRGKRRR